MVRDHRRDVVVKIVRIYCLSSLILGRLLLGLESNLHYCDIIYSDNVVVVVASSLYTIYTALY